MVLYRVGQVSRVSDTHFEHDMSILRVIFLNVEILCFVGNIDYNTTFSMLKINEQIVGVSLYFWFDEILDLED